MQGAPHVVCFGEALWDCLPEARVIGGAPLNVAYHLSQLGCRAWPMSGVGSDAFGQQLLGQVQAWGLPGDLLQTVPDKPTGVSRITLEQGIPTFEVVADVAWDYIDLPQVWPAGCQPVQALVFGSLSQRSEHNRDTLQSLFAAHPGALKVFDVNLRPPDADLARVGELARAADLVKLNDEELAQLLNRRVTLAHLEAHARELHEQTGCPRICVTAGAAGGGVLTGDSWFWTDAVGVTVRDTVGAGDSFLAALLHGLLVSPAWPGAALQKAASLAAFVAGSDGATPRYAPDSI